jgi:hypothetical protein
MAKVTLNEAGTILASAVPITCVLLAFSVDGWALFWVMCAYLAGGFYHHDLFYNYDGEVPPAPAAPPAPQPVSAPLGPVYGTQGIAAQRLRTEIVVPPRSAHECVYIWEDLGRFHNGRKIYKIGRCRADRAERRMNEVARRCAAEPRLIAAVPVLNAGDVESYLLRHCGEKVPGDTDGYTEFRTITPTQLAFCLKHLEKKRAH